jgi:ssDNA-binding Zn-finger/Zn-ribbon topoisomerase 1
MGKERGNPRFFCENCGAEVPRNAKNCPKCGRFFASVRCPSCGFTGEEALFREGCPVCGYSTPPETGGKILPWPEKKKARRKLLAGTLPVWVYVTAVLALIVVLGALVYHLF